MALDDDAADFDGTRLMQALDVVNNRFGRGTVALASAGLAGEQQWSMKQERRTPGYTTDWEALALVRS